MFTKEIPSKISKVLNLQKLRYCKKKMQRGNFSSDMSLEYPHENKGLVQKKYYQGSFILTKLSLLLFPSNFRSCITNAHIIIRYKHFDWRRLKFCSHKQALTNKNNTRLNYSQKKRKEEYFLFL